MDAPSRLVYRVQTGNYLFELLKAGMLQDVGQAERREAFAVDADAFAPQFEEDVYNRPHSLNQRKDRGGFLLTAGREVRSAGLDCRLPQTERRQELLLEPLPYLRRCISYLLWGQCDANHSAISNPSAGVSASPICQLFRFKRLMLVNSATDQEVIDALARVGPAARLPLATHGAAPLGRGIASPYGPLWKRKLTAS